MCGHFGLLSSQSLFKVGVAIWANMYWFFSLIENRVGTERAYSFELRLHPKALLNFHLSRRMSSTEKPLQKWPMLTGNSVQFLHSGHVPEAMQTARFNQWFPSLIASQTNPLGPTDQQEAFGCSLEHYPFFGGLALKSSWKVTPVNPEGYGSWVNRNLLY